MEALQLILPQGWKRPRGWSCGVLAASGRLDIAGQYGWDPETHAFESAEFGEQWRQALANVCAVVETAGGMPNRVTALRVYVTDLATYRDAGATIADGWRETFGSHFPAITMVEVRGLTEALGLLEVEAVAQL